jgi:hypothetical protein
MADSEMKPSILRRNTSGAASRRSDTSRPSSPSRDLSQVVSGNYLDDHSQYHGHHFPGHENEEKAEDDESTNDNDLTEKETENTTDLERNSEGIIDDVRMGIRNERDVEAGPTLRKLKSSNTVRSGTDPNLVSWEGPDDPNNPKNWTRGRKWAATLVGKIPQICQSMNSD